MRPHELGEVRVALAKGDGRARVCDRRLDLAAVTDDRGVAEQALDVTLAEARDGVGVEVRKRAPERLPFAEDRQPRQAGLEAL